MGLPRLGYYYNTIIFDLTHALKHKCGQILAVLKHKCGQILAVVKIMKNWAKHYFHNWDTTMLL